MFHFQEVRVPLLIQRLYLLLSGIGILFFAHLQVYIQPEVQVMWAPSYGIALFCFGPLLASYSRLSAHPAWGRWLFVHMQVFSAFTSLAAWYGNFPWVLMLNAFIVYQLIYLAIHSQRQTLVHTLAGCGVMLILMLLPHRLNLLERVYMVSIMGLIGVASYFAKTEYLREVLRTGRYRDAFRDNALLLSSILTSSQDIIYALDKDYRLIAFNERFAEAFERLHGFRMVMGESLLEVLARRGQQSRYQDAYARALQGETVIFHDEQQFGDGHRWYEFAIYPIREGDRIKGISVFAHEETEKRQIQAALAHNEERLAAAVQGAGVGIWDWNLQRGEVHFSPRWKEMLGYRDEEIPNTTEAWFALVHPEDRESVSDTIARHIKGSLPHTEGEYRMRHKDGSWRWMQGRGTAFRDENGRALRLAGTQKDVTEQKRTEAYLKGALESSLSGIVVYGVVCNEAREVVDFEWRMLNAAAEQNAGRPAHTLIGKRMLEEMPFHREAGIFDKLVAVVQTGQPLDMEYLMEQSGRQVWYHLAAVRIQDGIAVTFSDISARKEGEIMLRGVMELSQNGIMVLKALRDAEGRLQDFVCSMVNQACADTAGTSKEALTGVRVRPRFGWEVEQFWPQLSAVLESGQPFRQEYFSPTPSSEEGKWFDITLVRLGDGVVVSFADISERKRVEQTLRNNEALLRTVIDNTPDWIFVKDCEHRYRLVNQSFASSYGLLPQDLVGKHELDLGIASDLVLGNAEEEIRGFWADDDEVIRTGIAKIIPEESTEVNGQKRVLSTVKVPLFDEVGGVWGLLGFVHDITRHKETEFELKKLSLVASKTDSGVVITDQHGYIEWVNEGFVNITGYALEEVVGKRPGHFLQGNDTEEASRQRMRTKIALRESFTEEILNYRKDGRPYWVSINITPIFNAQGELERFIGIENDVTPQKETEARLIQAKQAAEEAARLKAEFLSNMSHEIRTPMNAVIGMTGLLLETPLSPEQREYVETIRFSGDNLLTVINDILDFSKIEAGKLRLEEQLFSLHDLVEDVLDLLSPQAAAKQLELACDFAPELPERILGDPTRLSQILVNLLGNALKFTDEGEVMLYVERSRDIPGGCELRFTVRDTGIGIPADKLGKLFQSFSQVDASTTKRYGGTGLGLAISRQLVELMGGRVEVRSELGHGSAFSFTLLTQAALPPEVPPRLDGLKVLLMDDNASFRDILARQFARWGVEVVQSVQPAELPGLLAQHSDLGLFILDMHMSCCDSCELLAEVRILRPSLPVVLLHPVGASLKIQQKCMAEAQLSKPIRRRQLYEALTQVAHVQQMGRKSELVKPNVWPSFASLRVLMAEDNAVNQKVALRMLQKFDIQADVAGNGAEAVKSWSLRPYDLLFMDMQMPEMDGIEATRAIRQAEAGGRHTVIIAMTANAMASDRERCLAAGMEDYISKPVQIQDIANALARWFPEMLPEA